MSHAQMSCCSFESVKRTAEIEAELGVPAAYNFLPLDDSRYSAKGVEATVQLMKRVCEINPRAYLGLHVNACERFYPAKAPDVEDDDIDLSPIVSYLHQQIDDFRKVGVTFRTATAHGYGRGRKKPNNFDTPEVRQILEEYGIVSFDNSIRQFYKRNAQHHCAITDVGGTLRPRRLNHGFDITAPASYSSLQPGTFLRYLTHPGNFPVDKPLPLAMRMFALKLPHMSSEDSE
jgi:hypothetical protein